MEDEDSDDEHDPMSSLLSSCVCCVSNIVSMDTVLDEHDERVESVTIRTESCHPQAVGHHGDYIDYVKQAEESSHEPSLPVIKVQPIRIEGFGSNDLHLQCNKDDKV